MKKFLIFIIFYQNIFSILTEKNYDIVSQLQIQYYIKDRKIQNLKIVDFYIGLQEKQQQINEKFQKNIVLQKHKLIWSRIVPNRNCDISYYVQQLDLENYNKAKLIFDKIYLKLNINTIKLKVQNQTLSLQIKESINSQNKINIVWAGQLKQQQFNDQNQIFLDRLPKGYEKLPNKHDKKMQIVDQNFKVESISFDQLECKVKIQDFLNSKTDKFEIDISIQQQHNENVDEIDGPKITWETY